MERSILCLSCLSGQLKAVAIQRGAPARSWERPALVDDFGSFGAVVKEAVEKTGFTGQQVAIAPLGLDEEHPTPEQEITRPAHAMPKLVGVESASR